MKYQKEFRLIAIIVINRNLFKLIDRINTAYDNDELILHFLNFYYNFNCFNFNSLMLKFSFLILYGCYYIILVKCFSFPPFSMPNRSRRLNERVGEEVEVGDNRNSPFLQSFPSPRSLFSLSPFRKSFYSALSSESIENYKNDNINHGRHFKHKSNVNSNSFLISKKDFVEISSRTIDIDISGIILLIFDYLIDYMKEAEMGGEDWFDYFLLDFVENSKYLGDEEAKSAISRWSQGIYSRKGENEYSKIQEKAMGKLHRKIESKTTFRDQFVIKEIEIILKSPILIGRAFLDGWMEKSMEIKNFFKQHYVFGKAFQEINIEFNDKSGNGASSSKRQLDPRLNPFLKTIRIFDMRLNEDITKRSFKSFHFFMSKLDYASYRFERDEFEKLWKEHERGWIEMALKNCLTFNGSKSKLLILDKSQDDDNGSNPKSSSSFDLQNDKKEKDRDDKKKRRKFPVKMKIDQSS